VVLVAFVLVLLAAASFAAGIAASRTSDTLVYVSIAFSLGAFVILAVASFRVRQAARERPEEGPAAAPRRIAESEAHAGPLLGGLDPTQLDMTFGPEDDEEHEADEADVLDVEEPEEAPATTDGSFFDEYDDLTAAEIVPFLRTLDIEGLKWVRQRERAGAKRATVMTQVDQLIVERGGRTTAPRKQAAAKKAAPRKQAAAKKAAPARRAAKKSTRRR
jgi:hypothetical protein